MEFARNVVRHDTDLVHGGVIDQVLVTANNLIGLAPL
jgi:hypothetical protein